MAWQEVTYRLTSDCPMLMHNGQTADPLNKWAKAIKTISSKRKKTDADFEELARLEFFAGLYVGKDGPVIPASNVSSMIVNAARKRREGRLAQAGVFALNDASLEYDGPRDPDAMWKAETFRHVAIVRIGQSRIARTRPVFEEWAADVKLSYEDSVINITQLDEWFQIAGTQVGLGDWRPQHGRFTAERLDG